MIIPIPCVIVAGGKSSRMGSDKALLPFGGFKTLTQYQIKRIAPWFQSLHVSCKSRDKFDFDASFIVDTKEFSEFSPLVAIYSILKKFSTPVCILSVDTPFVRQEVFLKMYQSLSKDTDAIIARTNGKSHQLCAIYSPSLLPKIEKNLKKNQHKIRELFVDSNIKYIDFGDEIAFINLNRKDEYQKALDLLKKAKND